MVRTTFLLLAVLAVGCAGESAVQQLPSEIAEVDGFSFLGIEATEGVDSKAQHTAAMTEVAKLGSTAAVGAMNNCQNCVYVRFVARRGPSRPAVPAGACFTVLQRTR